jgi:hypothetical protein
MAVALWAHARLPPALQEAVEGLIHALLVVYEFKVPLCDVLALIQP